MIVNSSLIRSQNSLWFRPHQRGFARKRVIADVNVLSKKAKEGLDIEARAM
jgi:hypothetical protein